MKRAIVTGLLLTAILIAAPVIARPGALSLPLVFALGIVVGAVVGGLWTYWQTMDVVDDWVAEKVRDGRLS